MDNRSYVPVHTKDVKSKYGKGLSVTSMEGREAKHIAISRYSQNTNYGMRWQQIFRHEFLSLIWLRERGYNLDNYIPSKDRYVPNRVALNNFCFCGCPKPEVSERCGYCSHPHRQAILLSCQSGKLAVDKKLFAKAICKSKWNHCPLRCVKLCMLGNQSAFQRFNYILCNLCLWCAVRS